ncbi:MAG: hypothetical protein GY821_16545, partial [Gammaproteobacteria bacterium]|nr:hypothetical protein [Gammaproteobacteria bacterium]
MMFVIFSKIMSKKQLYIHIGTHKTGTTAIQKFLSANSDYLLKHGVLYPGFCRPGEHHASLVTRYSRELNRAVNRIIDEKEMVLLKKEFDNEVERSGAKKIILSSEELFVPLEKQQWQFIRTLCSNYEVFVIVYFRRQDKFIISYYNQEIKYFSRTKLPLLSVLGQEQSFLKELLDNYENVLSVWSDIVGDDHIAVVPYEGKIRNDVVTHFLEYIGIENRTEMSKPENRENISMPCTLIKLKRLINSAAEEEVSPYHTLDFMELAKWLNTLRASDGRKVSNPSPLSPQKRREIIAQYEVVNKRIAQRYLGREKLFEAPLPCDNEPFDETV